MNHPVFNRIHIHLMTLQYCDHPRVYTGFNMGTRKLYGFSLKSYPRKLTLSH